jgi:hypothetical protein
MSPERMKPETAVETPPLAEAREAERELEDGRPEHLKKPEQMSPQERENLCREKMIQGIIMKREGVDIKQRLHAADYIKKNPGLWCLYEPGVCDVAYDWIEDGDWCFDFAFTTDGPDDGNRALAAIPLLKE